MIYASLTGIYLIKTVYYLHTKDKSYEIIQERKVPEQNPTIL